VCSSDLFAFSQTKGAFPTIRTEDILSGKTPFVLAFLKDKAEFRIIDMDLPKPSAKRILKKLRSIGLVSMPKKGIYQFRDESRIVSDFCRNTIAKLLVLEAEKELGQIQRTICSFDSAESAEAVFIAEKLVQPKNYWLTAYSAFAQYGIRLMQAGRYYYSNIKPSISDIIVHTLAVSKDARSICYAALLAFKSKDAVSLLQRKKQTFGLGKEYIYNFAEFIRTKGRAPFEGVSFKEIEEMGYGKL
ncbi:hypothetical protein KJ780_02195, partial [Candidatus Micrarchaeota archaeon]|nr:hypothetical protein [Candidatus Micrarchaeota archaeon]